MGRMNNDIADGGNGDSNDYAPLGNSPWDNAQGGGITGDDITGGGWPGQGSNLPGAGGSRKKRTGPAKNSNHNKKRNQNKNNQNLSIDMNIAVKFFNYQINFLKE